MKLTIESTDVIVEIDGGPVRVWHGKTASGAACVVLVRGIAPVTDDRAEFDAAPGLMKEPPDGMHILSLRVP